jgi:Uma2 family endonuclease
MSGDDMLDDMTAVLTERRPWTEDRFFALKKVGTRVELFDGTLLVSPAPSIWHQDLGVVLRDALLPGAREAGLRIHLAINLRLRPGRIPIPDLVVARPVDRQSLVMDARDVELVCEITSTNVGADRILKMHYYAEAGIPRYLIVDPEGPILELYRLDGDKYVTEASARPGERLLFTAPVVAEIDPASLVQ